MEREIKLYVNDVFWKNDYINDRRDCIYIEHFDSIPVPCTYNIESEYDISSNIYLMRFKISRYCDSNGNQEYKAFCNNPNFFIDNYGEIRHKEVVKNVKVEKIIEKPLTRFDIMIIED